MQSQDCVRRFVWAGSLRGGENSRVRRRKDEADTPELCRRNGRRSRPQSPRQRPLHFVSEGRRLRRPKEKSV
jgi:hypothetical protein